MQRRSRQGFSLLELLITLGVLGIVMGIAALNLRPLSGDLETAANEVIGMFRQARARAMTTTSAYRITPTSPETFVVEYATGCGATTWTNDPKLVRTLREGVQLTSTGWQVCFNSRGLANSAPIFGVAEDGTTINLQVFLGGAVTRQ